MPKYLVLLKGINVGPSKRIAMADLRELLSGLGYSDVVTLLQSGNAVFEVDTANCPALDIARGIQEAILARTGLTVSCILRTGDELAEVVSQNPFASEVAEGSRLLVHFLAAPLVAAELSGGANPTQLDPGRIQLGPGVIYQWCPDGVLKAPPVATFLEKNFQLVSTGRNWNTTTKLLALFARGDRR